MSKDKVKHLLGISGGKDSAALAIYLNGKYSKNDLPVEYYTCDTGKELSETYRLINQLESQLGLPIKRYASVDHEAINEDSPFDFLLKSYKGFLPSQNARWCTKNMKLEPFEKEVGDSSVISYVGIRGDEEREGYISTKPNIQSIFPFRKNIWSLDVTVKFLNNLNTKTITEIYANHIENLDNKETILKIVRRPIDKSFQMKHKLDSLLKIGIILFNKAVFDFLKGTEYPVGKLEHFPLIYNDEVLVRSDIYDIIENSSVDLPAYYKPLDYEVDGEKGKYFRSRSGCFFCFYQQAIEWVWLLERHKDLFWKTASYEKEGYTWIQGKSLTELARPEKVEAIKREHLNRMKRKYKNLVKPTDWQDQILNADSTQPSNLASDEEWLDTIIESEGDMCANCFI
jgi:hypothetical protein